MIHNFGDAATAFPLGVAFLLRAARAERIAGLFVVAAIFVSACVGIVGFAGNWIAAIIRTRAGHRLDSPALIADGNHARADSYVSLAVVDRARSPAHSLIGWRRRKRCRQTPSGDLLAFAMERTTGLHSRPGYEHAAMAHPNSTTPKRSRRIKVTTAETSNEPPQPSLLEKKMNKAAPGPVRPDIRWPHQAVRSG